MEFFVAPLIVAMICALVYGRTGEWKELREHYLSNESLIKGEKQPIYFKYKKKLIWSSWNYYYVHIGNDSIDLIPPVLFRFFMPQMKLPRHIGGATESKGNVRFKEKSIYELDKCSVLIAY
jgi:hypothetical protein